jgi:signal transduction histidine kinase/ligand-binding sensor domain-containing protein/CheY-like chemotaxis protein/HPt (histidine-containing phosphotransfer) domain-containing protein
MIGLMSFLLGTALVQGADAPPLVLEHLTPSEGMPQGTVMASLQDFQGFMWLATEDGLVRYDGHEPVRYAYSRTANGALPGNFIRDIVEDAHHDLWIAIKDAGLARWNRATDSFTVYRHDPANAASLASDITRAVLVDPTGRVWIGMGDAGIDVLDPVSGRIEHLRHDPGHPDSLSDDQIYMLALDRAGAVWIGTNAGLDRWQPERHAFVHFPHVAGDPHTLSGNQVLQVVEDQQGSLWVGTFDGGLDRMDHAGQVVQTFRHDPQRPSSLASDDVHAILEDRSGHLWIGTSDGLDLLDRSTGQFTHYRHDGNDPGSLRDSYVMSLYEDTSGLVWIGTRAGGVSRWNPRSWELGGRRPNWLGGKFVQSFADAPDRKVWIASMGGGLVQFDAATGEATDIDSIVGRHNAIEKRVMALRLDRHDTLWIGTMSSGLKKLSSDGRLESIAVKAGDARSVSADGIMTIFEARDGRIWLGMHEGGANVLDPATGLILQLPFGVAVPGAISAESVTAIAEDPQGNIWMGTDGGGLNLARADGTVVKVFRHDPNDRASIPSNTVYALAVDGDGQIWMGTDGGGLARVVGSGAAPDAIHFEVVSREQGLSSDTVYGVVGDSKGRLWLSGDAGLMRFDPHTSEIKTYHREHGLQGEEFDFNAYHRLRDGRLCFGGPGGFNIFDPSRLTDGSRAPRVALTNLEVLGVPVPSATPYWLLDRIVVDYRASIVSLDFGALDFTSPKRNRLAYRVLGLSDRWIDLGMQRRVTLTNLDAGDHLLEVRAANADSVWSDPPLRLTVHRNPAPWRSSWAYATYALVLLLFVMHRVRVHRANIQRIVRAKERLESEVALRTRELVESNRQLGEAAQAKSNFLARMSHELRTPMNGVLGMTELLARTPLSSAQARLTRTISSSAHVLLHIVNDLLDLSKIQAGKVEFESLPLELDRLIEECTMLFAGAAEAKGIELIVIPPLQEASNLVGDPLRVRQILMNLVGNAVKFTLQGEVVVQADVEAFEPGGATLQITVTDTGVGMDAATIAKIFEPFTQADESTTRRFGGSGLGLAICRELAERMGGTIAVESTPKMGSTFRVSLALRTSDAEPAAHAPLMQRSVRILSRRPALAQSLARHASRLGLTVIGDGGPPGAGDPPRPGNPQIPGDPQVPGNPPRPGDEECVIADLGTHEAFIRSVAESADRPRTPLVIVGTAAQIHALGIDFPVDPDLVVAKPVQRDALHQAISAAASPRTPVMNGAAIPTSNLPAFAGHVLLVEDEPVNAAVAQGYLAELGCTSVWVESGAEAIARSATERFDLVMMDLNMPTMDGFATTTLMRQREAGQRRVPIVALTAHDAGSHRDHCLRNGMDDLMSKPYTLQQCAQLLDRWLERAAAPTREPAAAAMGMEMPDLALAATKANDLSSGPALLSLVDATAVAGLRKVRSGGPVDLYSKLVELFKVGSAAAIAQLDAALLVEDLKTAGAVCHKLASSAANVGALAFAADVRRLENICGGGDVQSARSLGRRLAAALPALMEELARLQLRESA